MPVLPPAPALPPGIDEQTLFRSLFLAYPDSLLVVDAAGTIVMCNPPAANLLGYTVEELVGSPVDALVPDAIRPRHAAFREGYSHAPRARPMGTHMELVARRKDGSEVMVEIALSPLQAQGLPLVIAAIRDIGAYPRVQQALQRAHYDAHLAEFARLVVDARDPHTLLDRVPVIAAEALQVDVAMVFLLESDRQALRVVSGVGMVPGEEIGALVPFRAETTPGLVLSHQRPLRVDDYRSEDRFVVPQAYLQAGLISGLAVPVSDRGNTIGALSVRSKSPRQFGDDEMRFLVALASLLATSLQRVASEDALKHAQRLESVGQLTGGIAHDFNNLLTVIQGNLQVLETHPPIANDGPGQELVGAAMRAARRGAELTGKLLAFSRRQVLQPRPVDVSSTLAALADMLRRTLDQHVRIEVDAPEACPPLLVDPVQLESALLNVAINARDAMPAGGVLRFGARVSAGLPAAVRLAPEEPAAAEGVRFVAISITDTGTGMSPEVKERALEPFFTTKEPGRGTGLGLSTVYGFVTQSHGALAIDSEPGAGTTVTLYIPQSLATATPAGSDPAPDRRIPPGLEVLLVEDDADVRSIISTFLHSLGFEVSAAGSGEQALLMQDTHAPFDLLLTDIALGAGMRGTELAARIQRQHASMPVLLMSGFSSELLDADRDSPPGWELLPKPCSRQELANAIAKVLSTAPRAGVTGAATGPAQR